MNSILPSLKHASDRVAIPRLLPSLRVGVTVLLALCTMTLATGSAVADVAGADIAPLSAEELQNGATDIVLATVVERTMTETTDGDWLDRRFSFTIEVEDVLKGSHVRGDRIEGVTGWNRSWTGSAPPPPSGSGHQPLPLQGEVAKFHLETTEDGSMQIMLPNGVELSSRADPTDPVRIGDVVIISTEDDDEEEAPEANAVDPFGWDVMLVLLAIPIMIGAFKQPGAARWILLGVSCLMLGGAAAIIILA